MFSTIEVAIKRMHAGEFVIVVDDEDRENEGDFVMAAEYVTPAAVNFLISKGRGLVCMPCDGAQLDMLDIHPMLPDDRCSGDTPFAISIDHMSVGTGISAAARAETIRRVLDPSAEAHHFRRPGHVFPLRARDGGVLERRGHTEAAVDLARLAGLNPSGVLCEILLEDGSTAKLADLQLLASQYNMPLISIEQLAQYRLLHETNEFAIPVNL